HKFSTAQFKISHRKLNMLGRQISGKPIDHAIVQMQFSEKRASKRIMNMLATAKDHAIRYKNMDSSKLIVAESWVTKGPKQPYMPDIKGRGRCGKRRHTLSKMSVVLKAGKTLEEQKDEARMKRLKRVASTAIFKEYQPVRNPSPVWAW
ncbi:ribosomal protein L22, partial [Fistulina hepatica ATCC 64428]